MKKVLSSNGIFEITDSLYENIKKNNPNLMEDFSDFDPTEDPETNEFVLDKLIKDKLGDENDKNLSPEEKRWIKSVSKNVKSEYFKSQKENNNPVESFNKAINLINQKKASKEKALKQIEKKHIESDEYENYLMNDDKETDFNNENELKGVLKEYIIQLFNNIFENRYNENIDNIIERYDYAMEKLLKNNIKKTHKEILQIIINCAKKELKELKEKIDKLENKNILKESEKDNKISIDDIFNKFQINGNKGVDKLIKDNMPFVFNDYETLTSKDDTHRIINTGYQDNVNINDKAIKEIFSGNYLNGDDSELYDRVVSFISEFITNDTIKKINEIYLKLVDKDGILKKEIKNTKQGNCISIIRNSLMELFNSDVKEAYNINYDNLEYLMEDIKNKDEEENVETPDTKENEKLLIAKLIILGFDKNDKKLLNHWGAIKKWQKEGMKTNNPIWDIISSNVNNLLKYLTSNSWQVIESTLTIPIEGKNNEIKQEAGNALAKHIFNLLQKYLFNTPIPKSLDNMIKEIKSNYFGKIFPWNFFKYNFGKKILGFMINDIKEDYIETVNNQNKIALNMKIMKMLKPIKPEEFWKNVMVYNCFSERTFDIINNAVRKVSNSRDSIWNVGFKQIMTGLNTRTYLYRIEYSDTSRLLKDNQENIDKLLKPIKDDSQPLVSWGLNKRIRTNFKINGKTLKKYDKIILSSTPKIYYIIITEGLFKKGKFLSNVANGVKNMANGDKASSNRAKIRKEIGL